MCVCVFVCVCVCVYVCVCVSVCVRYVLLVSALVHCLWFAWSGAARAVGLQLTKCVYVLCARRVCACALLLFCLVRSSKCNELPRRCYCAGVLP